MKKLYFFVLTLLCMSGLNAQLVDVITELETTGPIGELPAGYSSYKVYALLQDDDDRISAVYGSSAPSPEHRLYIGSSEDAPSLWNSELAGTTGSDNSCALWAVYPETEFDSYVTIGLSSAVNDACPDCAGTQSPTLAYSNPVDDFTNSFGPAFSDGDQLKQDLLAWDATYLLDNNTSCNGFGQAPDNRVLLFQATVPTGTLEFCVNIVVLNGGDINAAVAYVHDVDGDPGIFGLTPEVDGSALGLCFGGEISSVNDRNTSIAELSLVPNPASEQSVLSTSGNELTEIQVYNIAGQQVWNLQGISSHRVEMPSEHWLPGIYVVKAKDSNGLTLHRSLVVR